MGKDFPEDDIYDGDFDSDNRSLKNSVLKNIIVDVISEKNYRRADEILAELVSRGHELSIHRLRRLMHEASVRKVQCSDGCRYYRLDFNPYRPTFETTISNLVVAINHNNQMIFIKTVVAGAPLVAKIIDSSSSELEILGTIAGDDAVLVIPKNVDETTKIYDSLIKLFESNLNSSLSSRGDRNRSRDQEQDYDDDEND